MTDTPSLEEEVFELHWVRLANDDLKAPAGLVVRVTGPTEELARHASGLPDGPGGAEALAIRLRRLGARTRWGEPELLATPAVLRDVCCDWGISSIHAWRADPSLLDELAVGRWFDSSARSRAARRVALAVPRRAVGMDAAFWSGARAEATDEEWRLLTRGYSVLLYHRLAGELKPGQERVDLPWQRFDRQMRMLRRLRFRPLTMKELAACHAPGGPPIPRRSVLVTVDDAFLDVVEPLRRHAWAHPQLFVPTEAVGGRAHWLDDEQIAGWEELAALTRAGVELGAHSRTHPDLPTVSDAVAEREIRGSGDDLRRNAGVTPVAFAYPHGRHGPRERAVVRAAGYALAFTTQPGRNGAGADPLALRRVSVKSWDSNLSFAWKLVTGEQPPRPWERWLLLRAGIARRLGRARRGARAPASAAARPGPGPPPRGSP